MSPGLGIDLGPWEWGSVSDHVPVPEGTAADGDIRDLEAEADHVSDLDPGGPARDQNHRLAFSAQAEAGVQSGCVGVVVAPDGEITLRREDGIRGEHEAVGLQDVIAEAETGEVDRLAAGVEELDPVGCRGARAHRTLR